MLLSVLNIRIPLGNVVLHCACTIYNIKIVCVFSNHHKKQPALRFLNVQAAFDRERSSENYFSDGFDITGNMRISLDYEPSCVCCRPDYDMV